MKVNWKKIILLMVSLVLSVGIMYLSFQYESEIKSFENWGYFGVFIFSAILHLTIVFPAPTYLIPLAFGAVLNPWAIGLCMGVGALVGESFPYFLGKNSVDFESRQAKRYKSYLYRFGSFFIFASALIPNPLFDLGAIAAGAIKLPYFKFALATTAGKSIRFLVISLISARFLH